MFKKLTSFLFKEEEIILTDEEHKVEDITIQRVEPLKPVETSVSASEDSDDAMNDTKQIKKPLMIDIDEPTPKVADSRTSLHAQTKSTTNTSVNAQSQYRTKEILSPIHGSPHIDVQSGDPIKVQPQVKKRTPLTEVISPMYGKIDEEEKAPVIHTEAIMDMDIETMITRDDIEDEVQTSLFDYLEGIPNDED